MFKSVATSLNKPLSVLFRRKLVKPVLCSLKVYKASEWEEVSPIWSRLAFLSPYTSFYLSQDWISAWLETFGESLQTRILVFEEENQPVAACLLTQTAEWRGPFRVSRMVLNTGAEPKPDRTLTEFNNMICCRGKEIAVAQALGDYACARHWDEFAIDGIELGPILTALQTHSFPHLSASVGLRPTYTVDLAELRRDHVSYLDTLSPNTRAQIRRSLREAGGSDRIEVQIASHLEQAECFFQEMCTLHQARWVARGETGAFASLRRLAFHRALIRKAFSKGTVHLLRVACAGETLGILYNFVQNGKINFFQSGFHYTNNPRLKPGMLTHACAIQKYTDLGFDEYDFLVGDARYKTSLAKPSKPLAWVVFGRPNMKLSAIEFLRAVKRQMVRR